MLDYIFYSAHGLKADLSDPFLELSYTYRQIYRKILASGML